MNALSPGIKNLIIINVGIFALQNLAGAFSQNMGFVEKYFALYFYSVLYEYKFWQVFSYMFLHGGFLHLLFNMLALFFIGNDLERSWGTKNFLLYYLLTGLGAGIAIFSIDYLKLLIIPESAHFGYTIGASGAIFALILGYSLLFSERQITLLLFFFLPFTIKAKNLLFLSLALTIIPDLLSSSINISHTGHIGGVLSGIFFLILFKKNPAFYSARQNLIHLATSFKKRKMPRENQNYWRGQYHSYFDEKNVSTGRKTENLNQKEMTKLEIEEKIDELLDVISKEGISNLTKKEKQFLTQVSILYRHKFPQ